MIGFQEGRNNKSLSGFLDRAEDVVLLVPLNVLEARLRKAYMLGQGRSSDFFDGVFEGWIIQNMEDLKRYEKNE